MHIPTWILVACLLLTLLGMVLSICKLLGLVVFPWWVVLLPFAPLALAALMVVLFFLWWSANGCH